MSVTDIHERWRVIDPDYPNQTPEHFDTRERAHAEVKRYPWLVVQQRLAGGWEDSRGARLEKTIADEMGIKELPITRKDTP